MPQSYKTKRLRIELQAERRGAWQSIGDGRPVKGTEYVYSVNDENYSSLNAWSIAVREPSSASGQIMVQPLMAPGKKIWASIDRKSIVFVRARKHPYRGFSYCKINLADPTGWQTKKGARRGDRSVLPKWLQLFASRMRLKQTVTTTKGTDAKAQVIIMHREDHETMISLYFALKVWVLAEGFNFEHKC